MKLSTFALIFFSVSLNASAQIVLRKAMLTLGAMPSISQPVALLWVFIRNIYLWGGLACYAISIGTWLVVLSSTQVSVAYPMLSIGYFIAAILGYFFLGEAIGPARLGGIALICLGVLLVSRTA